MHIVMLEKIRHTMKGNVTQSETYIYIFVLLAAIYVVLSLTLPVDRVALEKYDITESQSRLLGLTITVPLVAIWFTALYGFLHFKAYVRMVRSSKEGKSFSQLASGLMIVAFTLPIGGIISTLLTYVARTSTDLAPTATIWRNYIGLILMLAAFTFISRGAQGLIKTLGTRRALEYPKHSALSLIVISSLFTALIVHHTGSSSQESTYYLPDWLIVTTLAIPYVYVWYKGMLAAYRLYVYKDKLRGPIYKKAYGQLAFGIAGIVGISIILQLLGTFTAQLNRLTLAPILLILYVLVGFYAVGYVFVARGAKKLKKIEEV